MAYRDYDTKRFSKPPDPSFDGIGQKNEWDRIKKVKAAEERAQRAAQPTPPPKEFKRPISSYGTQTTPMRATSGTAIPRAQANALGATGLDELRQQIGARQAERMQQAVDSSSGRRKELSGARRTLLQRPGLDRMLNDTPRFSSAQRANLELLNAEERSLKGLRDRLGEGFSGDNANRLSAIQEERMAIRNSPEVQSRSQRAAQVEADRYNTLAGRLGEGVSDAAGKVSDAAGAVRDAAPGIVDDLKQQAGEAYAAAKEKFGDGVNAVNGQFSKSETDTGKTGGATGEADVPGERTAGKRTAGERFGSAVDGARAGFGTARDWAKGTAAGRTVNAAADAALHPVSTTRKAVVKAGLPVSAIIGAGSEIQRNMANGDNFVGAAERFGRGAVSGASQGVDEALARARAITQLEGGGGSLNGSLQGMASLFGDAVIGAGEGAEFVSDALHAGWDTMTNDKKLYQNMDARAADRGLFGQFTDRATAARDKAIEERGGQRYKDEYQRQLGLIDTDPSLPGFGRAFRESVAYQPAAQAPTGTDAQAPTGTDAQAPTGTDAQAPTGTDAQAGADARPGDTVRIGERVAGKAVAPTIRTRNDETGAVGDTGFMRDSMKVGSDGQGDPVFGGTKYIDGRGNSMTSYAEPSKDGGSVTYVGGITPDRVAAMNAMSDKLAADRTARSDSRTSGGTNAPQYLTFGERTALRNAGVGDSPLYRNSTKAEGAREAARIQGDQARTLAAAGVNPETGLPVRFEAGKSSAASAIAAAKLAQTEQQNSFKNHMELQKYADGLSKDKRKAAMDIVSGLANEETRGMYENELLANAADAKSPYRDIGDQYALRIFEKARSGDMGPVDLFMNLFGKGVTPDGAINLDNMAVEDRFILDSIVKNTGSKGWGDYGEIDSPEMRWLAKYVMARNSGRQR